MTLVEMLAGYINAAPLIRWIQADPLAALLCAPFWLVMAFVALVMFADFWMRYVAPWVDAWQDDE